jgi:hypothetical protein
MYWYTGWRGREIEVMQDDQTRPFSWGCTKNGIHLCVNFKKNPGQIFGLPGFTKKAPSSGTRTPAFRHGDPFHNLFSCTPHDREG